MRLYIYRGEDNEGVPEDATHVTIAEEVTVIPERAFWDQDTIVSVIMHDNVTRIEYSAFADCTSLRYIRLSRKLEHIGKCAFDDCQQLRSLFLPPSVREIGDLAFASCLRLRILVLPSEIILANVGELIVADCQNVLTSPAIQYQEDYLGEAEPNAEANKVVNEWLQDRQRVEVESSPLHVLCLDTSISAEKIDNFLEEYGSEAANEVDEVHQMSALHILTMNPYSSEDAIISCFNANPSAAIDRDEDGYSPIDNAMLYNVPGLISMIKLLCINRRQDHSLDPSPPTPKKSGKKRKR